MGTIDWSLVWTNVVSGGILAVLLGFFGWLLAPYFEARSRKVAQERLLLIAKKRTEGVGIRNEGLTPLTKAVLADWIARMERWHGEAVEVVRVFSKAEAERLTTLDLVPIIDVRGVRSEEQLKVLRESTETLKRMDEILNRNLPLRGDWP